MLNAEELHRRGLEATNSGRHAQARHFLQRALDAHPPEDELSRILVTLANVVSELGSSYEGLELCDEALRLPGIPDQVAGLAHSQRALLLMRAGEGVQALREFRSALGLLNDDPTPMMRLYLNRGMVHLQRYDAEQARVDFAAAVDWGRRAGHPIPLAKAEFNLGYTYLLTGQISTALRLMDEAKPILDPLSAVTRAINEQDRAEVLLAAGMTSDAADGLRHAAAAFGTRRLTQRQGQAEFVLARLLLHENPAEARRVARRAERRFTRRGSTVWAQRASALALSCELRADRPSPRAVAQAQLVVAALRAARLTQDAVGLELEVARAHVRLGQPDAARRTLARARTSRQSPVANRLLERLVRSELSASGHRRADAFRHARKGLADLHAWQSSFGSLDLQSSLVGHGRPLALQGMGLAIEDGRPAMIFEWSERARALASRVTPLRPPTDPVTAVELTELRALHTEATAAESTGQTSPLTRRRVSDLQHRIRQRQWYGVGSGQVSEPASMAEVAAHLGNDGALVAYLAVADRLVALSLTESEARTHDLGDLHPVRRLLAGMQADLDMSSSRLPAGLRETVQASLRGRLDDLAARLVAPLAGHLGDRRLVIVPSGSLAGVPWTLLPGLFGRPLTVPRSASTWLAGRPDAPALIRGGLVAELVAGLVAGPRVERAEQEVRAAAKAWSQASVLAGAEADAGSVGALASSVDVFHVAAHGRHSADNPLFSGLELVDGPWFGYDIDQLRAIPSTVILSACELGRSSVRWGDETIGMTVAWLHAGARTVIASPASVDDDVACHTLQATHHHLAAGQPAAEALAQAMVEIGGPAPAPFVCFGAGW